MVTASYTTYATYKAKTIYNREKLLRATLAGLSEFTQEDVVKLITFLQNMQNDRTDHIRCEFVAHRPHTQRVLNLIDNHTYTYTTDNTFLSRMCWVQLAIRLSIARTQTRRVVLNNKQHAVFSSYPIVFSPTMFSPSDFGLSI